MRKINLAIILLLIFFALDAMFWVKIFSFGFKEPSIYFLNVGQGDSELIALPNNVKILIDGGGPNAGLLENLSKFLKDSRYIDLVIMTHPQIDHFGGLIDVLKNYKIGAFLGTGRVGTSLAYGELVKELKSMDAEYIFLQKGDRISYKGNIFDIIWPDHVSLSYPDLNKTGLVMLYKTGDWRFLFAADIVDEEELVLLGDLEKVNVLKVPHHGSKYSSSRDFLGKIRPDVAVIEVGKNSYGHPSSEVLDRLSELGSKILRTDKNGNIILKLKGDDMQIFAENIL